jgi:hypothetical protein
MTSESLKRLKERDLKLRGDLVAAFENGWSLD